MKIKQKILDKIDNPLVRSKLAVKLLCGEQNLAVHMRRNSSDGRLTKMDALMAISEEVGCEVTDILEEEKSSPRQSKHTITNS